MSELDKFAAVSDEMAAIENFIDWLNGKGYYIASVRGNMARLKYLLNEYYQIDAAKLEQERRELLRREAK